MPKYKIDIIELPYNLDALEPHISKEIMDYHYNKHHKGYKDALLKSMKEHSKSFTKYNVNEEGSLNALIKEYVTLEDKCDDKNTFCNSNKLRSIVRQFGGGLINHNFFFPLLKKEDGKKYAFDPESALGKEIIAKFNSYERFCSEMIKLSLDIFGSGWSWLVVDGKGELRLYKTFNQDNPWFLNMTPLIGIDVWEHAYYLQYKNDRKSYVEQLLKIINWRVVESYYQEFLDKKNN